MEGVTILSLMAAAFVLSMFAEKKTPPPKTAEQELGEAIAQYLTHGVNVRLGTREKKE
ncbi:MAG: hypothetical protein KME20_04185 [Kaiparowitsia implicata GSE-PSE-MK54-09C]|jgi:hypothetical protein|nr:hypothetical protein [Kaiparowitsia implicata GSE-PSE-MK54-09C]